MFESRGEVIKGSSDTLKAAAIAILHGTASQEEPCAPGMFLLQGRNVYTYLV